MTRITSKVHKVLQNYAEMPPGVLANLHAILMHGKLHGTGKMLILPVDQGFEHGPTESFISNIPSYDPEYHVSLAITTGMSAYAAPLGMLECIAKKYAGQIPLILKMNSANKLASSQAEPDQALTSSVCDALHLGCSAVGLTIYPGSNHCDSMIEIARDVINEAKSVGLPTVIWSYPRGSGLNKTHETSIDVVGYAAHIAALIGAHIIKVKIPDSSVLSQSAKEKFDHNNVPISTIEERVAYIKQCAFAGRRIVLFSGGPTKDVDALYNEVKCIKCGGGDGSIIGRNVFQRPREDAVRMLSTIVGIYRTP